METIYHLFDVPAEKRNELTQALTTPKGFTNWWSSTEEVENGLYRIHFSNSYHKDFKRTAKGEHHVSYECVDATPEWKGTSISFKLTEEGGKTVVHFRHEGWKDQTPMFGLCNFHWALYMKRLKELVETGNGNPTKV